MSFRFSYVCDLLEGLADNRPEKSGYRPSQYLIERWFALHDARLRRDDFPLAALLSILLPEKRTDRVYGIQESKLRGIFGRAQGLGRPRLQELDQWNRPGSKRDFAECIEAVLKASPCSIDPLVTIKEIDDGLNAVASGYRYSSPTIRALPHSTSNPHIHLGSLYKRLSPRDAKWFTRLILKNYGTACPDPRVVYKCCHPALPSLLRVQDDFVAAGQTIQLHRRLARVTDDPLDKENLAKFLAPVIGIKVGRQTWMKGRSIKNCLEMGHGRMSCEEKLDGEYCQIHIDLSKGEDCIQIFSKSGKNSTQDRRALHGAIRRSLQIGKMSCPFKKRCILEGELLVYSDKDKKILAFDKIRKHVSRSGAFLGTDADSQRHHWEHLMIVYYDILVVDDESLLNTCRSRRFVHLERLVTCIPGRSALVRRHTINFDRPSAGLDLQRALDKCTEGKGEGLVLKADDPYFSFGSSRRRFEGCPIKLKKQYLQGNGDVGDFAVVAARYDAAKAKIYGIPHLKYTHFYIACLLNKDEVLGRGWPPRYRVTNVVELNKTQMRELVSYANPEAVLVSEGEDLGFEIAPGIDNGKLPSILFPEPPVFDITSFSFEKPGNTGFWCPRFPGVSKIHLDRTWRDVISFDEMQELAKEETGVSFPVGTEETRRLALASATRQTERCPSEISQETRVTTPAQSSQLSQSCGGSCSIPITQSPSLPTATSAMAAPPPPSTPSGPVPGTIFATSPTHSGTNRRPAASLGEPVEIYGGRRQVSPQKARARKNKQMAPIPPTVIIISDDSQSQPRSQRKRIPLGEVTSPSHSQSNEMPRPIASFVDDDAAHVIAATQHSVTPTSGQKPCPSGSPSRTPTSSGATEGPQSSGGKRKRALSTSKASSERAAKRTCLCPGLCRLARCQLLLAPCVSRIPWLTEDLLSFHGVDEHVSDPAAWNADPTMDATEMSIASTANGPRPVRKVALVESRRKAATEEFLRRIEAANLARSNGRKEYVMVFDWRVMEALAKEEETYAKISGEARRDVFDMRNTNSIWRKHWVGLV
ncbi:hypothetical protein GQ53DRAFT_749844 [Thozetella sp. PMI_491]|nr:hypothetical protein GQ53DRAFT_749844 [Thozetella sp. PMI_491]